nr:HIT domain-containing protein [Desulfitobacterium hafniense]
IQAQDESLIGHMLTVIKKLAQELKISKSGYRVVTNIGIDGGQIVRHLHFHLIGGQMLGSKIG